VRPSTSYITVATRSRARWFDLTAVRGPGSSNTHARTAKGVTTRPTTGKSADRDGNFDSLATQHLSAGGPPLDAWFDEYDGTHDLWTLSSAGSNLAHYAMWPAKLAQRLVLMLCPAEVCTVCGEPRRRIEVTTNAFGHDAPRRSWAADADSRDPRTDRVRIATPTSERMTLGWSDCGHGSFQRGVVLDPFAGTGTTVAVADLSGRDGIGIDIDAGNAALYKARYDECKKALFGTPIPDPNQAALF